MVERVEYRYPRYMLIKEKRELPLKPRQFFFLLPRPKPPSPIIPPICIPFIVHIPRSDRWDHRLSTIGGNSRLLRAWKSTESLLDKRFIHNGLGPRLTLGCLDKLRSLCTAVRETFRGCRFLMNAPVCIASDVCCGTCLRGIGINVFCRFVIFQMLECVFEAFAKGFKRRLRGVTRRAVLAVDAFAPFVDSLIDGIQVLVKIIERIIKRIKCYPPVSQKCS